MIKSHRFYIARLFNKFKITLCYFGILVLSLLTVLIFSFFNHEEDYKKGVELSRLASSTTDYNESIKYHDQANILLLSAAKEYLTKNNKQKYADCIAIAASNLIYSNKSDQGIDLIKEGIKILEKQEASENVAEIGLLYHKLGVAYYYKQEYDIAEAQYNKALVIREKTIGSKTPDYIKTIANLANTQRVAGKYPEAYSTYQIALNLYPHISLDYPLNMDSINMCIYSDLSNVLSFLGDSKRSEEYGLLSLGYATKLQNHDRLYIIGLILSENAYRSKNYQKAIEFGEQCEKEFKFQRKDLFIIEAHSACLNIIGSAYSKNRNYTLAKQKFQNSLKFLKSSPKINNKLIAEIYANLSLAEAGDNNPKEAINLAKESIKWAEGDSFSMCSAFFAMGVAQLCNNSYDISIEFQQKALTALLIDYYPIEKNTSIGIIKYAKREKTNVFYSINAQVEILQKMHSVSPQDDLLQDILTNVSVLDSLIYDMRNGVNADGSKYNLTSMTLPVYESGIKAANLLYQHTKDMNYLQQAFVLAEKNKASALMDDIRENQVKLEYLSDDPLVAKERNLKLKIAKIEKDYPITNDSAQQVKMQLVNELDATSMELKKKSPELYNLKYAGQNPNILKDIQAGLAKDQAMVEYFHGDSSRYAFVVTKNDLKIVELNDKNDANQEALLSLLHNNATDWSKIVSLGHEIYKQIFQPLEWAIPSDCKRLIIVPDGELAKFPFETLITKAPDMNTASFEQEYLLKKYSISYALSGQLFLENAKSKSRGYQYPFVGFAPDFSGKNDLLASRSCGNSTLPNLLFNGEEVKSLQETMKGKIFLGNEAGSTAFQENLAKADVVHIATHACMDNSEGENSRIFFSNDEFLTLNEIYNLTTPARMVVLSACETGLGKIHKGEGMISLNRAFAYSGCPSTVTSLWAVGDKSTSLLMQSFYRHLKEGDPKDVALQKAKLELLQQGNPDFANPAAWGAFVQYGSAEPLYGNSYWWLWVVGILGVWVVGFWIWRKRSVGL